MTAVDARNDLLGEYMKPTVAILMGSDSDAPTLKPCGEVLKELGISYATKVLSAHRTPDETVHFVKSAKKEGFKVYTKL